ncbi:Uncharacterised protein [Mycobacteroides abscessus subsp. massiliense]|uniref:hypothetical protein n=1 Tax=Mycobacteroides abscessus TaxID=36809 RepID=UPI0009CBFE71|nr:hypothetical protein [Mycobacteroides abscessus]SLH68824.1 Uncharacterised protein [Mycobacteroides abscessus subsp. massiliense]SLI87927.1 Uncharacterised protein [Mycobacteroides abscessus subsp. massiliense]
MPELASIAGVELIKAGTWDATGSPEGGWTTTPHDLAQAIRAHQAGVLRKPIIKIGHTDPRFDGGPALGYVDNLRLTDGGHTLIGDFINMPAPVAALVPHAYPDRSIEALIDYQAPDGSLWPLVLTAVALLGEAEPAVETLKSLQDVGDLYGVPIAATRITLTTSQIQRARAVAVAAARRQRTKRFTSTKG